ncbi:hypothetical protein [Comamonas sp. JC664]|uniref:hypothetical protein n=1 Tax=Comamonas sp. JC664 TaxID=2801917 RepID=UPI00360A956F
MRSAAEPYASLAEAELADRLVSRAHPIPSAAPSQTLHSQAAQAGGALQEVDQSASTM